MVVFCVTCWLLLKWLIPKMITFGHYDAIIVHRQLFRPINKYVYRIKLKKHV